jgi:hypothetical protein
VSLSQTSTGYCRSERRQTRWRFAGYVPPDAVQAGPKPAPFYQSCGTCTMQVLTLGGPADLPDAVGLCMAILVEFKRRRGSAHEEWFDEGNVLGDLQAYLWQLYSRWDPHYHLAVVGRGNNFRGYATGILRNKIKTFVARDTGEAAGGRKIPKAHARSVSTSWEAIGEQAQTEAGGLDDAVGRGPHDPTFDRVAARGWVDAIRDRTGRDVAGRDGGPAHAGAAG